MPVPTRYRFEVCRKIDTSQKHHRDNFFRLFESKADDVKLYLFAMKFSRRRPFLI